MRASWNHSIDPDDLAQTRRGRRHGITLHRENPALTCCSDEKNAVRSFLAKEIMAATTGRNLGYVKETDTYFLQYGVNFFNQSCTTLLIGDTIYHKCKDRNDFGRDLRLIAAGTQYDERESQTLRPNGPILLDAAAHRAGRKQVSLDLSLRGATRRGQRGRFLRAAETVPGTLR